MDLEGLPALLNHPWVLIPLVGLILGFVVILVRMTRNGKALGSQELSEALRHGLKPLVDRLAEIDAKHVRTQETLERRSEVIEEIIRQHTSEEIERTVEVTRSISKTGEAMERICRVMEKLETKFDERDVEMWKMVYKLQVKLGMTDEGKRG